MAFRPSKSFWVTVTLLLVSFYRLSAQQSTDLRQDKEFFQKKIPEFRQWLRQNGLDGFFRPDSLYISRQKVTLFLRASFHEPYVCDSLQCAWTQLQTANRRQFGQYFHERMLHKWSFLTEVHPDQAEIVVRCHDPAHFLASVSSKNGQMPAIGRNIRSGAVNNVPMPLSLEGANTGENNTILRKRQVKQVCQSARRWLINYYKPKGTPILWNARIDTSFNSYDEFILEITHLNNEICPDGYFEYHRIYMKGNQSGEDVLLSWEFQGKYGSGILFPPRKNDYKDLDLRYKANLQDYQMRLFKQLLDFLRQ